MTEQLKQAKNQDHLADKSREVGLDITGAVIAAAVAAGAAPEIAVVAAATAVYLLYEAQHNYSHYDDKERAELMAQKNLIAAQMMKIAHPISETEAGH